MFIHFLKKLVFIPLLILLSACAVGPDYQKPSSVDVIDHAFYIDTPATDDEQTLITQESPVYWWMWFQSPELNKLVETAFINNPSLDIARARLAEAEQLRIAAGGALLPQVDLSGGANYTDPFLNEDGGVAGTTADQAAGQSAQGGFGPPNTIISTASAAATYDLNLFGRLSRQLEAAAANVDVSRQALNAARLSVAEQVVEAYLEAGSALSLLETQLELIASQRRRLDILQVRFEEGLDPENELLLARAEIAALEAEVPVIQRRYTLARNILSELTDLPIRTLADNAYDLQQLRLPATLPVVVPTELVRIRPDIVAAERALQVASANIGIATAALYPSLVINGSVDFTEIEGEVTGAFGLGASLLAPLFNGGQRRAERRATIAAYGAALGEYRQAVLASFRQVADGVVLIQSDGKILNARRAAVDAAAKNLDLADFQYEEGAINLLDFIIIQRNYQDAVIALRQALNERFSNTAALLSAVGQAPLEPDETTYLLDNQFAKDLETNYLSSERRSLYTPLTYQTYQEATP